VVWQLADEIEEGGATEQQPNSKRREATSMPLLGTNSRSPN
jgi:hypothetical protein